MSPYRENDRAPEADGPRPRRVLTLRERAAWGLLAATLMCALGAALGGVSPVAIGIALLWIYGIGIGIGALVTFIVDFLK